MGDKKHIVLIFTALLVLSNVFSVNLMAADCNKYGKTKCLKQEDINNYLKPPNTFDKEIAFMMAMKPEICKNDFLNEAMKIGIMLGDRNATKLIGSITEVCKSFFPAHFTPE